MKDPIIAYTRARSSRLFTAVTSLFQFACIRGGIACDFALFRLDFGREVFEGERFRRILLSTDMAGKSAAFIHASSRTKAKRRTETD